MSNITVSFSESALLCELEAIFKSADLSPQSVTIGFSGGIDSSCLLHSLSRDRKQLGLKLKVIHFNHGLHQNSDEWQAHCEKVCAQLNVELLVISGLVCRSKGIATEEAARNFRYTHIADLLEETDIYLTAHQADDQAETLLLNLMRGSGLKGLSAIPDLRRIGKSWVVRPMLKVRRSALQAYLVQHEISWMEDPANLDESFDRNFIRHRIIPELEQRWPAVIASLNRTSLLAKRSANNLSTLLSAELANMNANDCYLPIAHLHAVEPDLAADLVRQWLQTGTQTRLPFRRYQEFFNQLQLTSQDSTGSHQPEIRWEGWIAKKYQNNIWLNTSGSLLPCPAREWTGGAQLVLDEGLGSVRITGKMPVLPADWRIQKREPRARIRVHIGGPRRRIRNLFQEYNIPPWMRDSIPILYWDNEAMAVGDWVISPIFREWLNQGELNYIWAPQNPALKQLRSDCHRIAIDPQ